MSRGVRAASAAATGDGHEPSADGDVASAWLRRFADERLLCQTPLAHEIVGLLSSAMNTFDARGDAGWVLRKTREILTYWVRCLSLTYGHMFQSLYFTSAGRPLWPPNSQLFVMSRVHMSCQTLFFEAMRRSMTLGLYSEKLRNNLRIIYQVLEVREELATHLPYRLCCRETAALLTGENLADAEGPNLGDIGEVPWLASEVYTVCEPGGHALDARVRERQHEMERELVDAAELVTPSEPEHS